MKPLISEPLIRTRVIQLGQQISQDYVDIVLVCILKGSVVFLADLMRQITIPLEIDFMECSSYGVGVRESTGKVKVIKDLSNSIENRHVLIIEDIVDSGYTLQYIITMLKDRKPTSLKICTLLDKPDKREVDIPVDYVGFTIDDEFVVGYGLDADEQHRGLPYIGALNEGINKKLF